MRPLELASQLELRRSIGSTRRQILLGSVATVACVACAPANVRGPSTPGPDAGSGSGAGSGSDAEKELSEIERSVGGRVGVLHVCLVYGSLLLLFPLLAFFPLAAAPVMTAAFVLSKTWLDLRAHERDHAALAAT